MRQSATSVLFLTEPSFCLCVFAFVNILVPLRANGETFGLEQVLDQKFWR